MTNAFLAWVTIAILLFGYLIYLLGHKPIPESYQLQAVAVSLFFYVLVSLVAFLELYDQGEIAILAPIAGLAAFLFGLATIPSLLKNH